MDHPKLSPILLLVLLSSTQGLIAASAPTATEVLLSGRTVPGPRPGSSNQLGALPQLLTWPASSARVQFESSDSVRVALTGGKATLQPRDVWVLEAAAALLPPDAAWGTAHLELSLDDGQAVAYVAVTPDQPELVWERTDLGTGPHNLTITLLTEPRYGAVRLDSVSLGAGGRFLSAALPPYIVPGRRILVIGDSFSAGFGNIAGANCSRSADDENALLAFPALAARALGAELQLLAWSGAGAVLYPGDVFHGDAVDAALRHSFYPCASDYFLRQDALDNSSAHDPASWVPQLVVLAVGTNDFHAPALMPPFEDWVDGYLGFVKQVAATYPGDHLLQLAFPLEIEAPLLVAGGAPRYMQYMGDAFKRMQAESLPNVHFLQFTADGVTAADDWCFMHPDVASHKALASQLVSFVKGAMPWFVGAAAEKAGAGGTGSPAPAALGSDRREL